MHTIFVKRKPEILHRDISFDNIVYYEKGEEVVGILIDFDLASYYGHEATTESRSGTAPFMAREVLNLPRPYVHGLHHDLESLLYVVLWFGLQFDEQKDELALKMKDVLRPWRVGGLARASEDEARVYQDWLKRPSDI